MAKANLNKLYKNKTTGKWMKPDPLVTDVEHPGWREASNREISDADVGPIKIVPGQALGLGKRWQVTNFANDANALKEWLGTDPNAIWKNTGGGRPHDLGVSTDGGETYKLIDPAPVRYLPRRGEGDKPTSMLGKITLAGSKAALRGVEYLSAPVTDPAEFGRDILDMSVELLQAAAVSTATVGGGVAAPITGAAAGYYAEEARQAVGVGLGMNKEVSQTQSAMYGAATGIPQLGRSIVLAGRKMAPVMKEFGAKMIGSKADTQITDAAVMMRRINDPAGAGAMVADVEKEAAAMRHEIANIFEQDFPEKAITTRMEQEATGYVDMTRELKPMAALTMVETAPAVNASEGVLATKATKDYQSFEASALGFQDADLHLKSADAMNHVYGMLRLAGVQDPTRVPIPIAADIKDTIWKTARDSKVFNGREVTVPFKQELRALGGRISESIRRDVDTLGPDPGTNKTYSQLMDKMKENMDQMEYWQQAAGVWEYKTADMTMPDGSIKTVVLDEKKYLDAITGNKKMVSTIRNFWGDSYHGIVKMLGQMKNNYGLDLQARMERTAMSTMIGKEGTGGAMPWMPQLSAIGGPKMAGMFGGLAGGAGVGAYLASGSPLLGAGVGLATALGPAIAASPRVIVGGAKKLGPSIVKLSGGVAGALERKVPKTVINLSTTSAIREFEREGRATE